MKMVINDVLVDTDLAEVIIDDVVLYKCSSLPHRHTANSNGYLDSTTNFIYDFTCKGVAGKIIAGKVGKKPKFYYFHEVDKDLVPVGERIVKLALKMDCEKYLYVFGEYSILHKHK